MTRELFRASGDPRARRPAYLWLSHVGPKRRLGPIFAWTGTAVVLIALIAIGFFVKAGNEKRIEAERREADLQRQRHLETQREIERERQAEDKAREDNHRRLAEESEKKMQERTRKIAEQILRDKR